MNLGNQVVYQIYPKSFCDSNHDGWGDIQGIISKLDILENLGVDYLWITPFFVSPQRDNGYDIADYYAIDPRYGTMQDVEELIEKAKQHHLKIMLDMVFNHTSTEHEWFQKALQGDPVYKDYYIFKDPVDGHEPTNWISKFGGSAWQYVPHLNQYYLHLFDQTQADLNWENPEVRKEMAKIVRFWMAKGIKGFRFDVVNLISKPEVFQDDEIGDGRRFYTDGRHVHQFLQELNQNSFGQDDTIMTVGEMSSTAMQECVKYAGKTSQELNMVFSFHHLKVDYRDGQKWQLKPFDFLELKRLLASWQVGMMEHQAWNALFYNNHDQPRANSRFVSDVKYLDQISKMLAVSIHMAAGTPYIYQGEEIGMANPEYASIEQYRDVESLNYYQILRKEHSEEETMHIIQQRSRDNSRTPVQWTKQKYAGFSDVEPWLSIPKLDRYVCHEEQMGVAGSIFETYRTLIQLRKQYEVIQKGSYEPELLDHPTLYCYRRYYGQHELLVICSFYPETVEYPGEVTGMECLYTNEDASLKIGPYGTRVYYRKKES